MKANWQKRFALFLTSQCITLFGSQLVQMAIVWHVTLHTQSGAWVAAFSICSYLPQFFLSFLGGVWADRYDRKRLIIGADLLIAAVTLGMMLMMPYITAEPVLLGALLGMSIIRSAFAGIQTPAVSAVIPQLVPQAHLMRCNGINAAMQSLVQFAAPAAAAVVLSAGTLRATLAIDIMTAVLGTALLAGIRLEQTPRMQNDASSDMRTGIRYACTHAAVRDTLLFYGLFLFWTVPAGYLSGLLVSRVYGDTYWYLTAVELAGFGGMAAGGLLMSLWNGFKTRKHTLAMGFALFGAMAVAMGVSRCFAAYLVFMALYGVALTVVQTSVTTLLQEHAQDSMQGRVFGLMSALYASCYPVGMALFGPLADWMDLRWIMLLSGAALLGMACAAYASRNLTVK